MSENPYSQPETDVAPASGGELHPGESRSRPIGHGWSWIRQAWSLFSPAWGQWILALLLFMIIMMALQFIPFIGGLAGALLGPVFGAGVLSIAHRAREGGGVEIADLFAGFRERTGSLVGLGAINLLVTLIIFAVMAGVMFTTMDMSGMAEMDANNDEAMAEVVQTMVGSGAALAPLIMLALLIPWMAAYWFAVPLIFFGGTGIGTALKSSLVACLRNILPLLWYSIIAFVLIILASIPFFLGWLVVMPLFAIAYYTMFRDIFSEA